MEREARQPQSKRRIDQRRKQIEYGKRTEGYLNYMKYHTSDAGLKTPDPEKECSVRSFNSRLREWRRLLHSWDDILVH
jgi:hypothetical protein